MLNMHMQHATHTAVACTLMHMHIHIHMNHDGKAEQICLCVTNLSTVCLTDQQGSQSHTHSLAHCTHDRAHRRSYASSEMTITGVQLEHLSCIFLCPYSCFINIIRIDALTALVRSVKDTRKSVVSLAWERCPIAIPRPTRGGQQPVPGLAGSGSA